MHHFQVIIAVTGVHRVMGELSTATDKAEKAIAEGKAQLQKNVEKVRMLPPNALAPSPGTPQMPHGRNAHCYLGLGNATEFNRGSRYSTPQDARRR